MSSVRAVAAFLYDFVVGDDWRVAVGVVAALLVAWGVHGAGVPAWWLLPVAALALLGLSLRREAGRR